MAKTSIPRSTKELDNLRHDICVKAGLPSSQLTPTDFIYLEADIKRVLPKAQIEEKTLKRLFGYDRTNPNSNIRRYTVDTLSQYLGFNNWEAFLESLVHNTSGTFSGDSICADQLNVGDKINIAWAPDRTSTLHYLGNRQFEVFDSKNASWQIGDTFFCHHLIPGQPLYVDQLSDSRGVLKSALYVVGELGGISLF